jgi:hypothetical protein
MKVLQTIRYALLLSVGTTLLLSSCIPSRANRVGETRKYIGRYDITVIDNCQYIVVDQGDKGMAITHKGDCTNPIHPRR